MFLRTLLATVAVAGAFASSATAADTPIAPDPVAKEVTALDGTVVWVSGEFGNQVLVQQTAAGVARVAGAPAAKRYYSIDLGRDAAGQLVLTYMRCPTLETCVARRDDLHGHRAGFKGLVLSRCSLSTAPAVWRNRVAYGLLCAKGAKPTFDARRSGLYVKTGAAAPKRLPLPKDAVRFGIGTISSVDLRGMLVAAVAADIYEYAFSEAVNGTRQRSFLAAASEGDSDAHARGLALGAGGTLWSLTDAEHAGDPNQAIIHHVVGTCQDWESMENPAGPDQESGFRATDLAVDGDTLYLVAPGTGIVAHEFVPAHPCSTL